MTGVTYELSRNMSQPGIQYTFTSTPKGTDIFSINIELLTTAHDIHDSINKQAIMDSGIATFEIYMEDLLILDPSYNYQDISINIIVEQLSDDNDLSEAVALYNEIITIKPSNAVPNPVTVLEVIDQDEHCLVNIKAIKSDTIDKFKAYYISDRYSRKYKTQVFNSIFTHVDDTHKYHTLDVTDLSNGTFYECYLKPYNSIGQGLPCDTFEMKPTNIAHAPTFTKVETIGLIGSFDLSNVKITLNWADLDAESYAAYTNGIRHVDASNSYAKLRIGTNAAILDASNLFIYTGSYSNKMVDIPLTNGQLVNAATHNGVTIERNINMASWFTREVAITAGGSLRAQIVYDSNLDGGVVGDKPQGSLSLVKHAYLQADASLNNISVEVVKIENVGQAPYFNGSQKFYFNGQIPSQNTSGVTLSVTNGSVTYDELEVTLSEGSIMHEQSIELQYSDIITDQNITAKLLVPDRNNPVDIIHTYERTFKTSKFKTPSNMAEFEFTGNRGPADPRLHTNLTNVNKDMDNKFDSDTLPSNVKWELFNNVELTGNALKNANYIDINSNVDISHNYLVEDSYYLKVTKYCTLAQSIVDNYNAYGAQLGSSVTHDIVSVKKGPIYYMQNPALDEILVNVDVATGKQTFYFNGQIASQDASGATLTVTNGSTKIIDASQVTLHDFVIMHEKSVHQLYDDIVSDRVITATLTQVDRNGTLDGASPYTYTATKTFTTYKFKTPDAPSASLSKNLIANDETFKASLTNVNANNGYDLTNITAQLADNSESGLLADCSGVFDLEVESSDLAQTINLYREANFVVDAPYWMNVTKSYRLNDVVYNRYNDVKKSVQLAQSSSVNTTPYFGPAYYMGNPVITAVNINEADDTVSVVVDTHGATLATNILGGSACTLVLVAKDHIEKYASGEAVGPMGTGVHTLNTIFSTEAKADINDSDFAIVTFKFVLSDVEITNNATCIAIIDATNGHSAKVLKNFPNVTSSGLVDDSFNSAVN